MVGSHAEGGVADVIERLVSGVSSEEPDISKAMS